MRLASLMFLNLIICVQVVKGKKLDSHLELS
jgi:hypothetical protein